MLDVEGLHDRIRKLYQEYEDAVAQLKKDALCKPGCSFCCTEVGAVGVTTLEALVPRKAMLIMGSRKQKRLKKAIRQNRREMSHGGTARCPFPDGEQACMVYEARPFSCRRLYSVRECRPRGATMRRPAVEFAARIVRRIQEVDDTGYSGHLAHILHPLDDPAFRKTYLSGAYHPERIAPYGRSHGIVINRVVAGDGGGKG
ncbi:MAG: YkgJ family cysteine cluster protein [Desulfatibacillaceae bacterium]